MTHILLASGSLIRQKMLLAAGIAFDIEVARIDEEAITAALEEDGATARDVADALAEYKARKVARNHPASVVIGSDQVLEHKDRLLRKPTSEADALGQLQELAGSTHRLYSAAVIYHEQQPIWRHVSVARLTMRQPSHSYLTAYVERNWESIQTSVGSYKIEEEGVRLFSRIEGDTFTIQGLPLLPLLNFLGTRGFIDQ